jgi:hypothetical protein
MPKQTGLEKAIAQIDAQIVVLQHAKQVLADQQRKQPVRRPKPVAVKESA